MRRFFRRLLFGCAALLVCAVIGGLMSELNHRRYRLRSSDHQLVVERGLFLPLGFGRHQQPAGVGVADLYAPLPLPTDVTEVPSEPLDDRTELDRALFTLLYGWAKPRLLSPVVATQRLAVRYVERLEMLPALSEEQRQQLRQLRAEVALVQAQQILASLGDGLRQAQHKLQTCIELGSLRAQEARETLVRIDGQLESLKALVPQTPQTGPQKPW